MKILLVGNYPLDQQESMRRYTQLLACHLRERGQEVVVTAPAPVLRRVRWRSVFLQKWLGYADKFLLYPWRLKRLARDFDLVHVCDHSNAMYVRRLGNRPHVVTCHDLLAIRSALGHFPENRVSGTGRVLQRWIAAGLRRAERVVCVSENTREDLQQVLGIPRERTVVIPLPVERVFAPVPREERERTLQAMGIPPDRRYFLHVGANHWYKNRFAVLPVFAALRTCPEYRGAMLVMAGQPWPETFARYLAEHGLSGEALCVDRASDRQLSALYSGAEALLFPSLYEGFGWPILEAQACGCPVATADRPPMNSVAGEGVILMDPADPAGAARRIAAALREADLVRAAGFRNLRRFESDAVTDAYLATYEGLSIPGTLEYA